MARKMNTCPTCGRHILRGVEQCKFCVPPAENNKMEVIDMKKADRDDRAVKIAKFANNTLNIVDFKEIRKAIGRAYWLATNEINTPGFIANFEKELKK